ncbi:GrpB family protein [Candidatus Berkelbacteria bacterium]|nr:GrpB family protein [Candidatus Berkelbacteria bacterium]
MATEYARRKFSLQPLGPEWAEKFQHVAEHIRPAFGALWGGVEHVGSTAVPGMIGKPTLDVLVLVSDIAAIEAVVPAMEALGYEDAGAYVSPESRLFVQEHERERLINIHVFEPTHPQALDMVAVRDFLRSHPAMVQQYVAVKQQAYAEHPNDYAAYRKPKDALMVELVKQARSWHDQQG